MDTEPTIGDVLKEVRTQGFKTDQRFEDVITSVADLAEAVNTFAENTEKRFDDLGNRLTGVETRLTGVENKLDGVERKLDRSDGKVNSLVNILEKKTVITLEDKTAILA